MCVGGYLFQKETPKECLRTDLVQVQLPSWMPEERPYDEPSGSDGCNFKIRTQLSSVRCPQHHPMSTNMEVSEIHSVVHRFRGYRVLKRHSSMRVQRVMREARIIGVTKEMRELLQILKQ